MFYWKVWFVLIAFVTWLVPLGVFIKPSDQQVACGGRRGICMCSFHFAKTRPAGPAKIALTSSQGNNPEAVPAGGAGNDFLGSQGPLMARLSKGLYAQNSPHLYSLMAYKIIEHIPKV